jgi:hypothetical protein
MTQILQALSIGVNARTLLGAANVRWDVLAAVSGAIYITNGDGDLVWITDRSRALHPRAVLLSAMPRELPDSGSRLRVSAGLLCCEAFRAAWHQAEAWRPGKAKPPVRLIAGFPDRVLQAIRQVGIAVRGATRLDCGAVSARDAGRSAHKEPAADGIAEKLEPSTEALLLIAAWHDVLPALRASTGVVGLGRGLTPAGDDFLGGYLYALRTVSETHCMALGIDWEGVIAWLHSVAHRTNVISHCMLLDHAHGVACAPLAGFVRAALEGASAAQLAQMAFDVAGIGESTGRNLLAGVGAACNVMRASCGGSMPHHAGRVRLVGGVSWRRGVARVR